jgi:hypothetical protein
MPHAVTPVPTPNPNAIRFTFAEPTLGTRSRTFPNADAARGVPWAERIFGVPGVVSLFGVNDFLTVTKTNDATWEAVVPHVLDILREAEF